MALISHARRACASHFPQNDQDPQSLARLRPCPPRPRRGTSGEARVSAASTTTSAASPVWGTHGWTGVGCASFHPLCRYPVRRRHEAIARPRYTGYEVWNKQRERLVDLDDVTIGHRTIVIHNSREEWIWSNEAAHDAIVTPELFEPAQRARRQRAFVYQRQERPNRRSGRRAYDLRGRVRCTLCGRKMQPSSIRDRV
ncbi:recombinase family protein [Streptomyces sp. NPDC048385]